MSLKTTMLRIGITKSYSILIGKIYFACMLSGRMYYSNVLDASLVLKTPIFRPNLNHISIIRQPIGDHFSQLNFKCHERIPLKMLLVFHFSKVLFTISQNIASLCCMNPATNEAPISKTNFFQLYKFRWWPK